jgi:hypothetical protein
MYGRTDLGCRISPPWGFLRGGPNDQPAYAGRSPGHHLPVVDQDEESVALKRFSGNLRVNEDNRSTLVERRSEYIRHL